MGRRWKGVFWQDGQSFGIGWFGRFYCGWPSQFEPVAPSSWTACWLSQTKQADQDAFASQIEVEYSTQAQNYRAGDVAWWQVWSPLDQRSQRSFAVFSRECFWICRRLYLASSRTRFFGPLFWQERICKILHCSGSPLGVVHWHLGRSFFWPLGQKVRSKIEFLVSSKVFLHASAAPICSSFSRAITPAVRDRDFPRGLPWVVGAMKQKLIDGNSHSDWLGSFIFLCISVSVGFWVENPDSSHLWNQVIWRKLGADVFANCYRLDFCRYNTPWRKRTRFFTDNCVRGLRHICKGGHQHRVLRGRSATHKLPWTKVAEPYPKGLCDYLAWSCCVRYGFKKEIPGLCCRKLAILALEELLVCVTMGILIELT